MKTKINNLTNKSLNLYLDAGIGVHMNAWNDPLFIKGMEMYEKEEMNGYQFYKFCERHGYLIS